MPKTYHQSWNDYPWESCLPAYRIWTATSRTSVKWHNQRIKELTQLQCEVEIARRESARRESTARTEKQEGFYRGLPQVLWM